MTKTLSVTVDDHEKADIITISGTQHDNQFNENIVLTLGQNKIVVNSQDLAQAIKCVVDFQQTTLKDAKMLNDLNAEMSKVAGINKDLPLFQGRFE